jgi:hypothetical protein
MEGMEGTFSSGFFASVCEHALDAWVQQLLTGILRQSYICNCTVPAAACGPTFLGLTSQLVAQALRSEGVFISTKATDQSH